MSKDWIVDLKNLLQGRLRSNNDNVEFRVESITSDSHGNLYACGNIKSRSNIMPGIFTNKGTFITKLDGNGNLIWSNVTEDSWYVAAGDYEDPIGASANGFVAWVSNNSLSKEYNIDVLNINGTKRYSYTGSGIAKGLVGGTWEQEATHAEVLDDGSAYLIIGGSGNTASDQLIKLDTQGILKWKVELGSGGFIGREATKTPEGGLAIAGHYTHSDTGGIKIFDPNGQLTKEIRTAGGFLSISYTTDGSYIVGGGKAPGYKQIIHKYSPQGVLDWSTELNAETSGRGTDFNITSIRATSDNQIYVLTNYGRSKLLDSSGALMWRSEDIWQLDNEPEKAVIGGALTTNNGGLYFVRNSNQIGFVSSPKNAYIEFTPLTPTHTLSPSTSSINEGSTLTTTVSTTNVATGTTLYWALSGTGITAADFSAGALNGQVTTGTNGAASFSHTLASDLTTEGTETLKIKLFSDSARTIQVGSTASVSISDTSTTPGPTYTITPSATSIDEGSTLTTTVSTTNVTAGTKLYYALSGTGIKTADFSAGSLKGSGSTGSDGKFSFSHTLASDLTTEGLETLQIQIFSDSARTIQVGSTASVSISDTSTTPGSTYTLTPSATTINEGATLTTSINTTGVAAGTTLYYSLSGTGINAADFSAGALTGQVTTGTNGAASFSHTLASDLTTEGTETLKIKLFSDSARTIQVGSTASVSISDTSTAQSAFSIESTNVWEGDTASVTITRSGGLSNVINLTIRTANGTAKSGSDYTSLNSTITFLAGETTKTISIATKQDSAKESDETFTVSISSSDSLAQFITPTGTVTIEDDDADKGNTTNNNTNGNNNTVVTGDGNTVNNTTVINNTTNTVNNNTTTNVTINNSSSTNNTTNNTNNITNNFSNIVGNITVDLSSLIQGVSSNADAISGSAKADVLGAGKGADKLTGASGADQFVFNTKDSFGVKGADTITDFNPEEGDKLVLSPNALPGLKKNPSFQSVTSNKALKAAQNSGRDLIYYQPLGQLFYDQNGRGKGFGSGGLFAVLSGAPVLTAENLGVI